MIQLFTLAGTSGGLKVRESLRVRLVMFKGFLGDIPARFLIKIVMLTGMSDRVLKGEGSVRAIRAYFHGQGEGGAMGGVRVRSGIGPHSVHLVTS